MMARVAIHRDPTHGGGKNNCRWSSSKKSNGLFDNLDAGTFPPIRIMSAVMEVSGFLKQQKVEDTTSLIVGAPMITSLLTKSLFDSANGSSIWPALSRMFFLDRFPSEFCENSATLLRRIEQEV